PAGVVRARLPHQGIDGHQQGQPGAAFHGPGEPVQPADRPAEQTAVAPWGICRRARATWECRTGIAQTCDGMGRSRAATVRGWPSSQRATEPWTASRVSRSVTCCRTAPSTPFRTNTACSTVTYWESSWRRLLSAATVRLLRSMRSYSWFQVACWARAASAPCLTTCSRAARALSLSLAFL